MLLLQLLLPYKQPHWRLLLLVPAAVVAVAVVAAATVAVAQAAVAAAVAVLVAATVAAAALPADVAAHADGRQSNRD